MKPGYVLLEILIALALGTVIIATLFTTFFQINKSVKLADQVVEYDSRAVLVRYQLEHDLSGAFVPYEVLSQQETTTEKRVTEQVQTGTSTQETVKKESTSKEAVKKEEPIERAFYAEMQEGNLKLLTFITTNPLPAYDSNKSRLARVTYHLVPEQQRQNMPPSYRLLRDEQPGLKSVQQKTEAVPGYELVRGIKSLKVEYRVRPDEQEKEQKKSEPTQQQLPQQQPQTQNKEQAEPKKERPAYEKFPSWGKDQIEKMKQNLPQFVDVEMVLWDRMHKKDRTFVFKIALMVQDPVAATEKKTSQKTEQQTEEKKEQGAVEQKPIEPTQQPIAQAQTSVQGQQAGAQGQPLEIMPSILHSMQLSMDARRAQ